MIAAYCWPQSALPGEVVALAISADTGSCNIELVRVGATETTVAQFRGVNVDVQPTPETAFETGCSWEKTLDIEIEPFWKSGFYLVRVLTDAGETAEAFFVVKASEPASTLLVLSTSTWAAYNTWGGPSYYTGSSASSLKRPLPPGFLEKPEPHRYRVARIDELTNEERRAHFGQYSIWSCAAGFANWEILFVKWAEKNGVNLDFATSTDLHNDSNLLSPYSTYLSVGHDEYWSHQMRDHLESWIDKGGFAVFLSGNTAFWQVRFDDSAETMTCFKQNILDDPLLGTADQHLTSTMWSDPLTQRPESLMTGVSFTRGGYAHCDNAPKGSGGYSIWKPQHWVFEGIDLRAGDIIGADPVIVGYECDGCELSLHDGLPVATRSDAFPQPLEVLGTAPARLWETSDLPHQLRKDYVGELNWVAERVGGADTAENRSRFEHGYAVMATFERGEGSVFTAGCTDWSYGLDDPDVSIITANLLQRAENRR